MNLHCTISLIFNINLSVADTEYKLLEINYELDMFINLKLWFSILASLGNDRWLNSVLILKVVSFVTSLCMRGFIWRTIAGIPLFGWLGVRKISSAISGCVQSIHKFCKNRWEAHRVTMLFSDLYDRYGWNCQDLTNLSL